VLSSCVKKSRVKHLRAFACVCARPVRHIVGGLAHVVWQHCIFFVCSRKRELPRSFLSFD
jgi:hypothetical protein